jgi:serine/threonine protein kinase
MLTALEHIHSAGYVHCDIKLDNICGKPNQDGRFDNFTLIDFGLAMKYMSHSSHIPEK